MKSHSPATSGGGATSTTAGNLKDNKKAFKGVRMRGWGSWVSEIGNPHQKTRIWLGSYSSPEAAARAYHAAFLCLKGSSVPILSSRSIQRIAASAAAAAATSSPSSPADLIKSMPFSAVAIDAADPLVDFRECQLSQHKWFMDDHTMNQFAFPATALPAEELNEIAGNITLWCFLR